jgi:predicted RNA binding protein YcfA (HicA-like mRNA interferase family)
MSSRSSSYLISSLEQDGWYRVGQTGSHVHFKHRTKPGKITVPHPVKDLPIGTLKSIEKASGVKLR